MTSARKREAGFTLAEILVVITLIAVLAGIVLINFAGSDQGAREATLKANVAGMREALNVYRQDHGWYPCDPRDANAAGNVTTFTRQLTWYTDAQGRVRRTKNNTYRYGPYLKKFPEESVTNSTSLVIDTTNERILADVASAVGSGGGTGGWYYEARSGNIVANLGSGFPTDYSQY